MMLGMRLMSFCLMMMQRHLLNLQKMLVCQLLMKIMLAMKLKVMMERLLLLWKLHGPDRRVGFMTAQQAEDKEKLEKLGWRIFDLLDASDIASYFGGDNY